MVHLNNAGQSLIPDENRNLAVQWLDRFYKEGAFCAQSGWDQTEFTRKKLAEFIGADQDEVSFFQTTASALSQVALGIELNPDDEILIWDQEYPTNYYPWMKAAQKSGAKLIQVHSEQWQTPARKLLAQVNAKTKVVAVSWVQYQTGAVTDLKEISQALKERNIWLVADVIQGVGVRPINFHETGFDVICGGSHKWLCSSYGAAFMAIKKERMSQLEPHEVGAMTYGTPDTEKKDSNLPKIDSSRYEPGSKAMIEIIAMSASLDLLMKAGINNIFNEASRLATTLENELKDRKFKVICNGPMINFVPPDTSTLESVMRNLTRSKISFAKRGPGIRLSFHAYNRDEEIQRVLNSL